MTRRPLRSSLLSLFSLSLACGSTAAPSDAGIDSGLDAALDAGSDASRPDAGPAPEWPGRLEPATALGMRRARRIARSIVHLHSPLSHDACDGEGWVDGALADPECLQHFRDSLCALHIDVAMITDHAPHVNEVDFRGALWIAGDDEPILATDGSVVASRMACPDGHRVLLTVGSENALMPLGLTRHPADPADLPALEQAYDTDGAAGVALFRAAGALVWQAHTEGRPLDELRTLGLDGLEIYNLHANVDPRIRENDLGLPPLDFLDELLWFSQGSARLPPDLAVLAFLSVNQNSLDKWDALLAEDIRVTGTGGCDAHENALPMILADGERADSYRRMMSWITNHLLVDDTTPEAIDQALERGRLYVTSEVFGSPVGFDFVAESGGESFEMGDEAPAGATLRVARPALPEGFPSEPAPLLTLRLLRSTAAGAVEVATSTTGDLAFVADQAGAYRAEVRMVPEHTRPFLGRRADALIREVVWVYSNPIFVTAP